MHKLIPHEVILVSSIPECNFCQDGTPGPYDFATVMGPWANGCETHWKQYRASSTLGTGKGQLWVTADQVDPISELKTPTMRQVGEDLRIAVENGEMDDEEFARQAKAIGLTDEDIVRLFA